MSLFRLLDDDMKALVGGEVKREMHGVPELAVAKAAAVLAPVIWIAVNPCALDSALVVAVVWITFVLVPLPVLTSCLFAHR
jgi:hypothetical protein